jgi:acetylornithine deacetylase/succinyl-diaminopimelate desuccinylase
MKGALAAMCAALVALEATKSSALPRGSVTLAAVIDEEMKSLGAEHLVESGFRADGAIIGEATENRLALGHKGLEWIEIHFEGKTAHGGKLETGVNAIVAAARYIDLCQRELVPRFATRRHQRLGPPTLNFGTIAGGDQPSTVAGRCRIRLDRRTVPGESWKSVSEELGEIGNRVEKEMPGLSIELLRMDDGMATLEHGSLDTNESDPIARATTAALRTVGADPTPTVFPAWSDAALLSAHSGIPSIVLGPGDLALAHSPNESVSVLQVIEAARIYALTAVHFCSNGNLK